jgi:hypothetical protein
MTDANSSRPAAARSATSPIRRACPSSISTRPRSPRRAPG